jgi:hypothetical protein
MAGLTRIVTGLVLFGASFGYVEAAVVVYLRALYEPIHQRVYPQAAPGALFPLIPEYRLAEEGPGPMRWLVTELFREAATLIMLAAVALAAAGNARQWFAAFLIAFGTWDIFFYIFLKVLLDWPASLLELDLLFLLPVPWVGPVLAPVLVAVSMIGAGVVALGRDLAGRPVRLSGLQWAAVAAGGLIVILAFCWDFRNTSAGGAPNPFPWPLFALGEGLGLAGFLHALWAARRSKGLAPSRAGGSMAWAVPKKMPR